MYFHLAVALLNYSQVLVQLSLSSSCPPSTCFHGALNRVYAALSPLCPDITAGHGFVLLPVRISFHVRQIPLLRSSAVQGKSATGSSIPEQFSLPVRMDGLKWQSP